MDVKTIERKQGNEAVVVQGEWWECVTELLIQCVYKYMVLHFCYPFSFHCDLVIISSSLFLFYQFDVQQYIFCFIHDWVDVVGRCRLYIVECVHSFIEGIVLWSCVSVDADLSILIFIFQILSFNRYAFVCGNCSIISIVFFFLFLCWM